MVIGILQKLGAEVFFDKKRTEGIQCVEGLPCYESEDDIDLLLVMGGDGSSAVAGSGADQLIQLLLARTAQDLAVDITARDGGSNSGGN